MRIARKKAHLFVSMVNVGNVVVIQIVQKKDLFVIGGMIPVWNACIALIAEWVKNATKKRVLVIIAITAWDYVKNAKSICSVNQT